MTASDRDTPPTVNDALTFMSDDRDEQGQLTWLNVGATRKREMAEEWLRLRKRFQDNVQRPGGKP